MVTGGYELFLYARESVRACENSYKTYFACWCITNTLGIAVSIQVENSSCDRGTENTIEKFLKFEQKFALLIVSLGDLVTL